MKGIVGNKYYINTFELYEEYGERLFNGYRLDYLYYDLRDKWNNLVCMDGEDCELVNVRYGGEHVFHNYNGELVTEFTLTLEEFYVAAKPCFYE